MHAKQQLRDAVVKVLSDNPVRWKYVYNTRIAPSRDVLPYLLVYCPGELIEPITIHPSPIFTRAIEILIVGRTRIPTRQELFEDELDGIQEEIEQKVIYDTINAELSNLLQSIYPVSSLTDVSEDENGRVYAEISITFSASVTTQEGAPETLI